MRKDRRGIEGLPLRLMLVALLISLTLPTVISSMGQVTSEMNDRKLAVIAEDIARTVEEMAASGPGNVRLVQVPMDLPAGMHLIIGGALGSVESARLKWTTGENEGSRYLNGVSVLTDGVPLILSSGDVLRLTCPLDRWGEVRAELV